MSSINKHVGSQVQGMGNKDGKQTADISSSFEIPATNY